MSLQNKLCDVESSDFEVVQYSNLFVSHIITTDRDSESRIKVVLKTTRCSSRTSLQRQKDLLQDIAHDWASFRSCHIIPFVELVTLPDGKSALAVPFYAEGNIMAYLSRNAGSDRVKLIDEAANGLQYLHDEMNLVHGNIRPQNILINNNGEACISDVGFSFAVLQMNLETVPYVSIPDGWEYKPLEELARHEGQDYFQPQSSTDVYCWGSTTYEVLCGKRPFKRNEMVSRLLGRNHATLPKPEVVNDELWAIIRKCWAPEPVDRPTISEVISFLRRPS